MFEPETIMKKSLILVIACVVVLGALVWVAHHTDWLAVVKHLHGG
jgi:hypothetical protein